MVKAIFSNPIARKAIATTMFATAVLGASAKNLNTKSNESNINQTEVVSKTVALALQNNAVKPRTVSHEIDQRIRKIFLKGIYLDNEIKEAEDVLKTNYEEFGTFGATGLLQRELDRTYINYSTEEFFDEDIYIELERKSKKNKGYINNFYSWLTEQYMPEMQRRDVKFLSSGKISYEEYSAYLDSHADDPYLYNEKQRNKYYSECAEFIKNCKDKDTIQGKARIIAFKVHTLDDLAFYRYLFEENQATESMKMAYLVSYIADFLDGASGFKD